MMDLDVPPLLSLVSYQFGLHALAWGLCCILLRESRLAVAHWAAFLMLLGTGLWLAGARDEPRHWIFYNGANILAILAFALMRRGTERFMRVERHDAEQLLVLLPVVLLIGAAGPGDRWTALRIVLTFGAQSFVMFRTMMTVQPALSAEFGRASALSITVPGVLIGAVLAALCLNQALQWGQPTELQHGAPLVTPLMYLYLAGGAAFSFGFMVMLTQRLVASLREASQRDALTGLYNRRAMTAELGRQWMRHRRTQSPLAVLVIDIDHFKKINDTLGHAAGDSVLVHLSSLLQSNMRAEDIVGRVGGEEFLLLLPDTQHQHAISLAERLRVLVRAEALGTTISIGIALAHSVDKDPESVVARADSALYRAKEGGRNRYEVAD